MASQPSYIIVHKLVQPFTRNYYDYWLMSIRCSGYIAYIPRVAYLCRCQEYHFQHQPQKYSRSCTDPYRTSELPSTCHSHWSTLQSYGTGMFATVVVVVPPSFSIGKMWIHSSQSIYLSGFLSARLHVYMCIYLCMYACMYACLLCPHIWQRQFHRDLWLELYYI